jgi:hypothetical protein
VAAFLRAGLRDENITEGGLEAKFIQKVKRIMKKKRPGSLWKFGL